LIVLEQGVLVKSLDQLELLAGDGVAEGKVMTLVHFPHLHIVRAAAATLVEGHTDLVLLAAADGQRVAQVAPEDLHKPNYFIFCSKFGFSNKLIYAKC